MYVASGNTIFKYNKGTEQDKAYWNTDTSPGGNIIQIASTGENLYALCSTDQNNDGRTVIKCFDKNNSSWTVIGGVIDDFEKVHNIFAAGDMLFVLATALTSTYYNIYFTVLYIKTRKAKMNFLWE